MNYLNFASLTNLFGNNTTSSSLLSTFGSYILNGSLGSTSIFGGSGLFGGYSTIGTTQNTGIYNGNGYNLNYNAAGQAKYQQNTAVIISILSMIMPSAATMLNNFISGMVNDIASRTTSQETGSSVLDTNMKLNQKQHKAQLEAEIQKDKDLINTLNNLSKPIEDHDDIQLQENNQNNKTIISNLKTLSQDMSAISPDFTNINSQLNKPIEIKFEAEFPDNLTEVSNFGDIKEHNAEIESYSVNLEQFITDVTNISISMNDINFDDDEGCKSLQQAYDDLVAENKPENADKIAKAKAKLDEYKNAKLKGLQEQLEQVKKENLEKANNQKDTLEQYSDMLSQLELDLDSLSDDERTALESNLNDGTLTFDELLELQCKEEDERTQAYTDSVAKNGDISSQIEKANQRIEKNTDKLKLLDFANEKFKDLDTGSDISRKQARDLRQKAQELYESANGTYQDLVDYAAGLGISLNQDGGTDTNGNDVNDNWTNLAKDGVEISKFNKSLGKTGVTDAEIKAFIGVQDDKITSEQAAKVRTYFSQALSIDDFKPQMGNLDETTLNSVLTSINTDSFKSFIGKTEQDAGKTMLTNLGNAKQEITNYLDTLGIKQSTIVLEDGKYKVFFTYGDKEINVSGVTPEDATDQICQEIALADAPSS